MPARKLVFNGNEIVYEDALNVGVAGIAHDQPDDFAELIVTAVNNHASLLRACKKAKKLIELDVIDIGRGVLWELADTIKQAEGN